MWQSTAVHFRGAIVASKVRARSAGLPMDSGEVRGASAHTGSAYCSSGTQRHDSAAERLRAVLERFPSAVSGLRHGWAELGCGRTARRRLRVRA
jgi:hypothetical protein